MSGTRFSPILRELGTTKDVRANEPGSEDQDSGRGKEHHNQNPTSPNTREKWGTLVYSSTRSGPPAVYTQNSVVSEMAIYR